MIDHGLHATIRQVVPYKALERQKRFMRRKMRKPADMKIRTYVNHLVRINNDELKLLPPFSNTQHMTEEELIDIVVYGLPKSWVKEMDRQDFDPFRYNQVYMLVDFCERLESAEDFHPTEQKKNSTTSNNNNKKSKSTTTKEKPKDSEKWCEYHESTTHNTAECSVVKRMKAIGDKDASKKKGKSWDSKSKDAKTYTKKELATIVKKATKKAAEKIKKDLNVASKKKRKGGEDSDEDSVKSVNVMEMKDVDKKLKNFCFDNGSDISV
jgi:hypothetical protein